MRLTLGQAIDHVLRRLVELDEVRSPVCYQASEAVYHLAGGKKAGLRAMRINNGRHWFLEGPNGEIIDVTAGQFTKYNNNYQRLPSYRAAKGASFFPNKSTLAKQLMKQ